MKLTVAIGWSVAFYAVLEAVWLLISGECNCVADIALGAFDNLFAFDNKVGIVIDGVDDEMLNKFLPRHAMRDSEGNNIRSYLRTHQDFYPDLRPAVFTNKALRP